MFSATLDPGANGFQAPVPIDFNVGEATSTFPDLAMSRGGQAYLAYRVVTDTSPANPPGYVGADMRVARYNGRLWSVLGHAGRPQHRRRRCARRPRTTRREVGIDVQGSGVVAWQEPDDEFVDRVWARRLFGTSVGIPLQVSPSSLGRGAAARPGRRLLARRLRLRPGGGRLPPAAGPGEQARRAAGLRQRDARRLLREAPAASARRSWSTAARAAGSGAPSVGGRSARPLRHRLRLRRRDAARLRRRRRGRSRSSGSTRAASCGRRRPAGRPRRNRRRGRRLARAARRRRARSRSRSGAPTASIEPTELSAPRGGAVGRPDARRLGSRRRDRRLAAGQRRQRADRRRGRRRPARPVPRPAARRLAAQGEDPRSPGTARRTRSARVRYSVSVDDEPVIEDRTRLHAPSAATTSTTAATGSRSSRSTRRPGNRQPHRPPCWSTARGRR